MKIIIHHIALAQLGSEVHFGLAQDFCVLHGLDTNQYPQIPFCDDATYVAQCGVQGLPYLPGLGLGGHLQRFVFTAQVNALVVAVGSGLRPVPLLPPPPPPAFVTSVQNTYGSRSSMLGTFYAFSASFSDGTDGLYRFTYSESNTQPAAFIGILKTDFEAAHPRY